MGIGIVVLRSRLYVHQCMIFTFVCVSEESFIYSRHDHTKEATMLELFIILCWPRNGD